MSSRPSAIWDNHRHGTVGEYLTAALAPGADVSVVSAFFTIYAYGKLRTELEQVGSFRLLFGEPRFVLAPDQDQAKAFDVAEAGLRLHHRLEQKALARQCADWIRRKAEIRSLVRSGFLHGKMIHARRPNGIENALVGSSNFTANGLGLGKNANIELNLELNDRRDIADLSQWFEDIWSSEMTRDVKAEVLTYLERLYADTPPEFLYYLTLFLVFEQFLRDQAEARLLDVRTGFFDSRIWELLYPFQKDGVRGAINKILRHNGCIIADSVGLGKTFEALAVIKYFELLNNRVLVLCPKKLVGNWALYRHNDRRNILVDDRFRYDIVCHTDMSRRSGTNDFGLDLANLNWGNYDLLVIDESHNFRNSAYGKEDENGTYHPTRYERVMEEIIRQGIPTKVLLLTATPVNNTLRDLRNQIYFITGKADDALRDSAGIADIGETLRRAQVQFRQWAERRQAAGRTLQQLLERLDSGFFKLLDELTIARSRKHIVNYYDLASFGRFPTRLKPLAESPPIDAENHFPSYDRINRDISEYRLSLYNPSNYVLPQFRAEYDIKTAASEKGAFGDQRIRERYLIGMMKVNFLKRLESSIRSFEITMRRTVDRIDALLERIRDFDANRDQYEQPPLIDPMGDEDLEALEEQLLVGTKLKFKLKHLDLEAWEKDLKADRDQLLTLYNNARAVTPERDAKLQRLKELIADKIASPINPGNRKVLVFTAFADTAEYLYEILKPWARGELGIHIALVSGGTAENRTTFTPAGFRRQTDYDAILTNFSPRAKDRAGMPDMPQQGEIDLLIATDCISEGQNLQDCDFVVNYDIHWNPVRIIQRFGRIDRLGSINDSVQLVNFWPTDDLNQYIRLKERVETRMALVDLAATGADNLLSNEQLRDLIEEDLTYRDRQLLRLKDEVLDLEDMDDTVALSEFTLDDFRVDLLRYLEANRRKLEEAPLGLYAVVPPLEPSGLLPGFDRCPDLHRVVRPGVVFCLRQANPGTELDRVNPLQPYFLIYIRDDGTVRFNFGQPKQVLTILQALCLGRTTPDEALCDRFDRETDNGENMSRYDDLLRKAVAAIDRHIGRRGLANLLTARNGRLPKREDVPSALDDFDLITWFVILGPEAHGA